jgi:hypothetical protein
MGLLRFYLLWIARAFKRSISIGDFWASVAGNSLTVFIHLFPAWNAELGDLLWQVPVYGVAAAIIFRLLVAPYELWKEAHQVDFPEWGKVGASIHSQFNEKVSAEVEGAIARWQPPPAWDLERDGVWTPQMQREVEESAFRNASNREPSIGQFHPAAVQVRANLTKAIPSGLDDEQRERLGTIADNWASEFESAKAQGRPSAAIYRVLGGMPIS